MSPRADAASTCQGAWRESDVTHVGDVMGLFDTAAQLPVLDRLAREFAVCDAWHSSLPGPTWPNRFFVHGASSAGMNISPDLDNELPWETFHGFEYANKSIYDALGKRHHYRFYQDKANSFSNKPSHGSRAAQEVIRDFQKIGTHGDASAYVLRIKAMLDAL